MKLFASIFLFVLSYGFIAIAQVPVASPSPAIIPVVIPLVEKAGIMAWITAHGGFQAAVLLLVGSAFSLLSAIREILLKFDGIEKGAEIPADKSALTLVNKICIVLGKIVDFLQGNIKH